MNYEKDEKDIWDEFEEMIDSDTMSAAEAGFLIGDKQARGEI